MAGLGDPAAPRCVEATGAIRMRHRDLTRAGRAARGLASLAVRSERFARDPGRKPSVRRRWRVGQVGGYYPDLWYKRRKMLTLDKFWAAVGVVLLCLWAVPSFAAPLPAGFGAEPDQVDIRLVTFGPGAEMHQYFGHNAMWVHDTHSGVSALFNYGMFSFGPDMLPNYLKGRLTFWVEPTPVGPTFAMYKAANRSITVQELNLGVEQKRRIVQQLLHDIKPENRFYQYDHFADNCGTRLLGLVDNALSGQLHKSMSRPARMSKRDHVRRYTEQFLPFYLALIFWMNDNMEEPITVWDEIFLPAELEHELGQSEYVNEDGERVPLVSRTSDLYVSTLPPVPETPTPMLGRMLWIGCGMMVLCLVLSLLQRRFAAFWTRALFGLYHTAVGLLIGLPGLLAALMWLFTEHTVTYHNENLLQSNPITFLLLPLGVMMIFGARRGMRWAGYCSLALAALSVLGLLLKVLPMFDQQNALIIGLLMPINLGLAGAHVLLRRAGSGARATAMATPLPEKV